MGAWSAVKNTAKSAVKKSPIGQGVSAINNVAHGNFTAAGENFLNASTSGAYGVGKDLAVAGAEKVAGGIADAQDAYNAPYNAAQDATTKAAEDSRALGTTALDMANKGIDRSLDQTLPAARQFSKTYEDGGELSTPGALENLYEERKSGVNPALEYDRTQGQRAIDNSMAAKGLGNSGAAIEATARLNQGISADNQRGLADLASGAQGAKETRLGGAFDRIAGLGQGRAGIVQQGTQSGIDNYTSGQLGGINADLQKANLKMQKGADDRKVIGGVAGKVWDGFSSLAGA